MGGSGIFTTLQDGNTLIKDHKTVVDALEDIQSATTVDEAKALSLKALEKIGELPTAGNPNPHLQTQMVDPAEATHVQNKMENR